MILFISHLTAVIALIAVAIYAWLTLNQVRHGPSRITMAWVSLPPVTVWLLITVLVKDWHQCQNMAITAFCACILWIFIVERRGLRLKGENDSDTPVAQ